MRARSGAGCGLFYALIAAAMPALAADFLVQLETLPTADGEPVSIHLVVLNSGAAPVRRSFPASITGVLRQDPMTRTVTFQATDGGASEVEVMAGGFARRRYSADVAGLRGAWELELGVAGRQSFRLELTQEQTGPAGATTRKKPGPLSREGAMDPDTSETTFFKRHFFPYEPFYFLAGPDSPNAKFQVSFKYRLVNTEPDETGIPAGWLYRNATWTEGLHIAYTQRSLWDLEAESAPFLDSSYMPEALYEYRRLPLPASGWIDRIGAQIGFQHESNGRSGVDSRSLNIAYLRMPFVFGDEDNFHVTIEPRAWFYVGDLSENPDLTDYRGYIDLRAKIGWARWLQVAGLFRTGQDFNNGSTQVDVTFPLHSLLSESFSLYLQAQYFNGYGESLLLYDERSETWRVGVGLFR